ncbi:putative nucleosome assembly protein [Aspergillus terreus]|uniref:Putative nucleosome assembly protein n=1 Tax=Aspergillus terreus TaxID=33178 RepID=A0A5M3ZGH0_ASPTE|nr:hypothetical protein ATETN484_0014027000 [Aspergillus terreus]GFF20936.1 putative nucleosome assembly protein [Aspergillus terreus]
MAIYQSPLFVDSLPPHLCTRVAQLQDLQRQQDIIHTKLQREIQALRKKYWLQYNPLYQQRFEIITGHTDPSHSHEPPGIPDFWLTAMKNHPDIGMRINEDGDERALKSLTNIQVEHLEDFDFTLLFHFAPNEFFSNSALQATFCYQKEFTGNRPDPLEAKGDHIDWKPGKQLTANRGGNTDVDEEDASGSFFDFFSPTAVPAEGDEEEREEREFLLWMDFEFAEHFQRELVPRAVEWYTGDARSEDEGEDEDKNEDEDSEDDSVEVSEDDSEDEEDAENSDDASRQHRKRQQLQMPQRQR